MLKNTVFSQNYSSFTRPPLSKNISPSAEIVDFISEKR